MKKNVFVVLSAALVALAGCQGGGNSTPSTGGNSGGNNSQGPVTPSIPVVVPSTPDSPSENSSPSMNQNVALALFKAALDKDYSNATLGCYQYYDDGESAETDIEYMDNGYVADFSQDLYNQGYDPESCMTFYYVDEDGKSYQYFEKDAKVDNSKGGWLTNGYMNADLSIWNAYFYLPMLLDNITIDDLVYAEGAYFVRSAEKIEELDQTVFDYYGGWFADYPITDISFQLRDGYITNIYGFSGEVENPINYIAITISDIGTTTIPHFDTVEEFSEATKSSYWEYKGWPQDYAPAYYSEIHTALSADQTLESDDTHDAVLELDENVKVDVTLSPSQFNPWDLVADESKVVTWHYDETKLEMKDSFSSSQKTFRAIGSGETEIYATIPGAEGVLESEHIKVKVNALPTQDKTGAIYDFAWVGFGDNHVLNANNLVEGSKKPYSIRVGSCASLLDGKNSDLFEAGKQYLVINPSGQEQMSSDLKPGLYFNFGEQQVSSIAFDYGIFYANHVSNLSWVSQVLIRTSNDGENFDELDVTSEFKANASASFVKYMECSFEPASIVEVVLKCGMIGKNLSVCLDSICFKANENCHNYVSPEDIVHVTGVTISAPKTEIFVEDEMNLTSVVAPFDATDTSLTWHVEEGKEGVVSIDNGKLTALAVGSAKVWATANDGNVASNELTIQVVERPSLAEYVGNKYVDENGYIVEIIDAKTTKIVVNTVEVEAVVMDMNEGVYTLSNDKGEEFCLEFASSRVDLSKVKYFDEAKAELATLGGTYYCELQVYMTSFTVKVGSLTANADGKYNVFEGESVYLSLASAYPSNANVKTLSYRSLDESKATVEETEESNYGLVSFLAAGEVTIRVEDANNANVYKDVTFVIAERVYPTDNNWAITSNKTMEEVDGVKTITIVESDSIQFGVDFKDITHNNKDVVYEAVDNDPDNEIVTINQRGEAKGNMPGEATVTVSVTKEDGTLASQTVKVIVTQAAEGALPAEVVGVWNSTEGDDNANSFTVTISADGKATISNGTATFNLTYDESKSNIENKEYVFAYDANEYITIYVNDNNFGINTDMMGGTINNFYDFNFNSGSFYKIEKQ